MSGYRVYFEVMAEPLKALCRAAIAERRAIELANDAMAKELGGAGCWWRGDRVSAIAFPRETGAPDGWKQVEGYSPNVIAAVPLRKSAAGKALAKRIADAPRRPPWKPLLLACGLPEEADWVNTSGFTFVTMSATWVDLPSERFFLLCARAANATWPFPDGLAEISEAQVNMAINEHNRLAEQAEK